MRERFLDALDAEFLPDGYHWRLLKPVVLDDSALGRIEVPADFVTDLGSIPRAFWNILPPIGPASLGFVAHDWLYATQTCSRRAADGVLFRAMKVMRASWAARWAIWIGVRLGGWEAWRQDYYKYRLYRRSIR
jgi:hypothetical protein